MNDGVKILDSFYRHVTVNKFFFRTTLFRFLPEIKKYFKIFDKKKIIYNVSIARMNVFSITWKLEQCCLICDLFFFSIWYHFHDIKEVLVRIFIIIRSGFSTFQDNRNGVILRNGIPSIPLSAATLYEFTVVQCSRQIHWFLFIKTMCD